jgi:hypothetical protein
MRARVDALYASMPVYLDDNRKEHRELIKKRQQELEKKLREEREEAEAEYRAAQKLVDCWSWANNMTCKYGDHCYFKHAQTE